MGGRGGGGRASGPAAWLHGAAVAVGVVVAAVAAADAVPTSRSSRHRLLGHLDNGIGFYRFAYKGSDTVYVGVMAQEVQRVRPDAVSARPRWLSARASTKSSA